MKRELDAAAEAGAVDRRDRRERQGPDAPEELVSRATALERQLARRAGELGHVRARSEDEGLARDHERRPVAVFELGQQPLQGLERGAPEEGRLRVVLAVVDRDERDVSGARQLELSFGQ
jgi:hypothetical protein